MEASKGKFDKYGVNSCSQIMHFLAQAKKETDEFLRFRESLNYSRKNFIAKKVYEISPSVINAGFARKGLVFANEQEKLNWIGKYLIGSDKAYGAHCYGHEEKPGKDFRGRKS